MELLSERLHRDAEERRAIVVVGADHVHDGKRVDERRETDLRSCPLGRQKQAATAEHDSGACGAAHELQELSPFDSSARGAPLHRVPPGIACLRLFRVRSAYGPPARTLVRQGGCHGPWSSEGSRMFAISANRCPGFSQNREATDGAHLKSETGGALPEPRRPMVQGSGCHVSRGRRGS